MFTDFLIQILFAFIFFLGIAGVGSMIIGILNFKTRDPFLYLAIAFFTSLCLYIILAVPFLTYLPNKLLTLKIFSGVYFSISFLILGLFCFKFSWKKIADFLKKNWLVFLATIFVTGVFFLQIYQTALFDEWLHRPVVKHFVENGDFPFVNPYNEDYNFNEKYHYGLYIPTAVIQLFSSLKTPESLDILKLSFAIASFFLVYGIVYKFSRKRWYASLAGILILFCGGSFFFWDGFTLNHLRIWGEPKISFNTPTLYLLAGITWINLTLSLAFIWFMDQVFYRKAQFDIKRVSIFILLLGGFYLISELFMVFILIIFLIIFLINLLKRKISFKNFLLMILISFFGLAGFILLADGVASQLISEGGRSSKNILTYRSFGNWGYPNSREILSPVEWWFVYLRNYFLEIILLGIIAWGFLKKKLKISEFPLFYISILISAFVPFLFSTSFGDINLSKINNLWTILIYIIFFYYLTKIDYSKKIFIPILILFFIGSIPLLAVNSAIQWRGEGISEDLRCRENNFCYKKEVVDDLKKFEKENPGIKRFLVTNRGEANQIVSETNSFTFLANSGSNKKIIVENDINFIFYSSGMSKKLNQTAKEEIRDCSVATFKSEFFKIIEIDKEKCQ